MDKNETSILFEAKEDEFVCPKLFVSNKKQLEFYMLTGKQHLGRSCPGHMPEISIDNDCVSRNHGYFQTEGRSVLYAAEETTNGIFLNRKELHPGEIVHLKDGDELVIPSNSGTGTSNDIMLVCAFAASRINLWESFLEAKYDTLTGLLNRRAFEEQYDDLRKKGKDSVFSLFVLDIDDFKQINDSCGHPSGDEALRLLSSELRTLVLDGKYAGRWGGDEFVGIIDGDTDTAVKTLDELNARLTEMTKDRPYKLRISAGVCRLYNKRENDTLETQMNNADKALYLAKYQGKGRIIAFKPL